MAAEELNGPDAPSKGLNAPNHDTVDWGLIVFLALGIVALLVPHISIPFVGVYWAAVVAVAVFVLWGTVMPTTCMSGGLICSLVAMAIFFNTTGLVLAVVIRFVVSLFS